MVTDSGAAIAATERTGLSTIYSLYLCNKQKIIDKKNKNLISFDYIKCRINSVLINSKN